MNFKSVEVVRLQAAFGLAQRASENLTIPAAQRKTFRAIAQLIWDACGENKKLQRGSGAALLERPDVVAIQRETEES